MKKIFDESRVFELDGKIQIRHIINESSAIDLTPHPTENRIIVNEGRVVTILSEEIENNGCMSVEMAKALTLESINKEYELNGV